MYYYLVVLKNVAKFTGMHLHRSLFSTYNLQLHGKRDAGIYSFLWVLRNFLGTLLLWKTSGELALKERFYEKWRTDILLFQKTDTARESVNLRIIDKKFSLNLIVIFSSFADISFLKYVTKIFCLLLFSGKKLGVF